MKIRVAADKFPSYVSMNWKTKCTQLKELATKEMEYTKKLETFDRVKAVREIAEAAYAELIVSDILHSDMRIAETMFQEMINQAIGRYSGERKDVQVQVSHIF